jgi:hypothetical protein
MQITCYAERTLRCAAPPAFDFAVDAERFPPMFTGYGPIPAIRSITLEGPLAVGVTRRIANSDGSMLTEQVTALDRPTRHAYSLGGFRAPFSWLVKRGHADWAFEAQQSITHVRWSYCFDLRSPLAYPLAALLLQFFMARAMQRCLDQMAYALDEHDAAVRSS